MNQLNEILAANHIITHTMKVDNDDKKKAILDIYKKEDKLCKVRSSFYMLYDNTLEDLLFYDECLSQHLVANMRKARPYKGISRN
jgi:hypothetical protein